MRGGSNSSARRSRCSSVRGGHSFTLARCSARASVLSSRRALSASSGRSECQRSCKAICACMRRAFFGRVMYSCCAQRQSGRIRAGPELTCRHDGFIDQKEHRPGVHRWTPGTVPSIPRIGVTLGCSLPQALYGPRTHESAPRPVEGRGRRGRGLRGCLGACERLGRDDDG